VSKQSDSEEPLDSAAELTDVGGRAVYHALLIYVEVLQYSLLAVGIFVGIYYGLRVLGDWFITLTFGS